jgi:magnesium-transporting ATPase (P-type)
MVTGDNKETAKAIAIKSGLIDPLDKDVIIIEGSKFIELTGGIIC